MDIVQKFNSLFQGRTDFIGAEEGGCVRVYADPEHLSQHMEWIYQDHLTGSRPPIGIYPVVDQVHEPCAKDFVHKRFVCKFGAIDIDFEDLPLAKNLWMALQALGVTSWVERSRSKGYHVWIFVSEWVPAVLVRSTLQVACDVVGYSPKEIFPKQTELADGSPGNYIRLPYPAALGSSGKPTGRYMLDLAGPEVRNYYLEGWIEVAWDSRNSRRDLEEAAALARPPKPRQRIAVVRPGGATEEPDGTLVAKMGGLTYTIWKWGPLDGADRSGTLFKLAHALRADGFQPEDTFTLLRSSDERWGKFYQRSDGEQRLWDIVEKVYEDL